MKTKGNLIRIGLLCVALLPVAVEAQFNYITNNGTIIITGYTGPGGAVTVPAATNGLPVTIIGSYAFQNRTTVTSFTVPGSVTNIGYQAFANCFNLTGVYFQGNAPSLDPFNPNVFNTSVTVYYQPGTSGWNPLFSTRPTVMLNPPNPAGSLKVTLSPNAAITNGMRWQVDGGIVQTNGAIVLGLSVGSHTVSFSPLNGWAMPANQTVVVSADSTNTATGVYGQLTYLTNNGVISIFKCTASGGALVIPGAINGWPVTSIGSQTFQNANNVTGITIPGSVTNIGNGALAMYNGLWSLLAITVDENNPLYSSTNGVLFNKNKTRLIQYPTAMAGNYAVPQGVTNIGNDAFSACNNLTGVVIPNSVTIVSPGAFYGSVNLTTVTFGTNVSTIGSWAFQGCHGLTSITLPSSIAFLGGWTFAFCTNLSGVYFMGNAPDHFSGMEPFDFDDDATIYYLPWTVGWPTSGEPFGGRPIALWLPQAQISDGSFGVQTNQFGFNITWANDTVVIVEACTDMANPDWTPVGTNTLTEGASYFSDPQWTNYPGRYYRLRAP